MRALLDGFGAGRQHLFTILFRAASAARREQFPAITIRHRKIGHDRRAAARMRRRIPIRLRRLPWR
jgi:hypothetical protein